MSLKNIWTDKVDGQDIAKASDINSIANAVIDIENLSIENKLDKPTDDPVVGKVLKVKTVNEDGTFACEWAEETGGVTDVTVNGKSVVDENGAAEIPIANEVKSVLTSTTDPAWTADEQAAARERMGAADAKAVGELKSDLTNFSLGVHTDGFLYIFHKGKPIGSGVSLPSGVTGDVVGNVDSENNIIVTGALADGTYTVKYEMEDGTTIDIGELVLDSNVYYSVTNTLTNCINSNSATQAVKGESYSATITANSGYELSSVVVTMGGSDVTVTDGVINIASVTGNIVITAVAEETTVEIVNQIPISIDSSGVVYNGTGYKQNVRLKSDGVTEDTVSANTDLTGYIPAVVGDEIRIKNMVLTPTEEIGGKYLTTIRLYDASFTMLIAYSYGNTWHPTLEGDVYTYTVPSDYSNTAYIRVQAQTIDSTSIITVNQVIS